MQIMDCLDVMTKQYLNRVIDSIFKENIPKGNEEQLKSQIEKNIASLTSKERINEALQLHSMPRTNRILTRAVINILLEELDHNCTVQCLYEKLKGYETGIIEKANDDNVFALSNQNSIDIYRTVLEVALEDADISKDEFALLEKLRQKLQVNRLEHQLLESQLGMFPQKGNKLHSFDDLNTVLLDLQKKGILFYCNKADPNPLVVLPEEIASIVAETVGFEMRTCAQKMLHETLTLQQLKKISKHFGLPTYGSKQNFSDRLIESQCKPSEMLNILDNNELKEIIRKLPGVTLSGKKHDRLKKVINYFAQLTSKDPVSSEDPREIYYQYLEELAARNNQELYRLGIIKKDREMEDYFEKGTSYLFEMKLHQTLIKMDGNDHADGGIEFPNGELLLWDNKGKEQEYTFPKSHADQFLRYIRESAIRVNVFLIVVPSVSSEAKDQALKLKLRNPTDTDIALITAQNLKFVAEKWTSLAKNDAFNLNIFNTTGILDRTTLEERMKILL